LRSLFSRHREPMLTVHLKIAFHCDLTLLGAVPGVLQLALAMRMLVVAGRMLRVLPR
jgi:hypothetical protein